MDRGLLAHHMEDLQRSGLSGETIEALGFYSGTAAEVKAILGFDAGPGLVIPYPCVGGAKPFWRVKPDKPPIIDGKPAKYLSPKGATVRAYIPPKSWEALKDCKTPVIITEGEKKAAKGDQEGFPCIGLGGVWSFYQEHQLIPDLAQLEWRGRMLTIAYDSDIAAKSEIKEATFVLERELVARGGQVRAIRFKPAPDGSKVGLDDFLVGQSSEALRKLLGEGKSALTWEIEDITQLSAQDRLQALQDLFKKLAQLEPVELEQYRVLCLEQLEIPRRDFQAQLSRAKEELECQRFVERALVEEVKKTAPPADPEVQARAYALLGDPALLYQAGKMVQSLGVAGEDSNIRILYLAVTSRITNQPISITPKGESASGKSYVVGKVLEMFPPSAYLLMTGMSRQALLYMVEEESFAHRTIVIFERWGAEAADYNIRTLQSEGKAIFWVAEKDPLTNKWVTRRLEKEGPTNFIITTTSPDLQLENETRYWSLIMDESPQLTLAAKIQSAKRYKQQQEPYEMELAVWRQLQNELKPVRVCIPYGGWLAEHTPNRPLRMRRDFNKLLALIEVIALLHQYQRQSKGDMVVAGLEDYFMARELVEQVFPASLAGINKKVEALVSEVERLYQKKVASGDESPVVKPIEIASALDTSSSSISRWLKPAIEAGLVEVVSETGKGHIKSVKPGFAGKKAASALPTVEELAEAFPELAARFRAVHPVTGDELTLEEAAVTAEVEKNSDPMIVKL